MVQKKLPLINSAHGSDTRNIINELINLFNNLGYTYNESLQMARDILDEAQQTNDMNESVQQQINTLILENGTSDAEVVQARIDSEGNEYDVLKTRLDKKEQNFSTQLAQIANFPVTNIIDNGNFGKDLDGWVTNAGSPSLEYEIYSTPNSSLNVSGSTSTQVKRTINLTPNHTYYLTVKAYCARYVSGVLGFATEEIQNGSYYRHGVESVNDEFETVSTLFTPTSEEVVIYVGGIYLADLDGYIDDIIMVDLTETFGAGKEPKKYEFEEMISKFGYIEGTKNSLFSIKDIYSEVFGGTVTVTEEEAKNAFIEEMNKKAEEIGMFATNYVNPHGLEHADQLSTAKDTVLMGIHAVGYDDLVKVWNKKTYTFEIKGNNARTETIDTSVAGNALENYYYIFGGKTGTNSEPYATQNLLVLVNAPENNWFVGAVFEADSNRYQASKELFDIGNERHKNNYKNIVRNGDFSQIGGGIQDWVVVAGSPEIVDTDYSSPPYSLNVNSSGASSQVRQDFSVIEGHKYYIGMKVKCTRYANGTIGYQFRGGDDVPVGISNVTNDFEIVSNIEISPKTAHERLFIGGISSADLDGCIDDVIVVDLTETYGKGNEPTKLEFDEIVWNLNFDISANMGAVSLMPNHNPFAYEQYDIPLLWGKNANLVGHQASITKVMTSMVTLDYVKDLNEKIEIRSSDIEGGSGPEFYDGDIITFKDALYCLMLPSSNTIASALSRIVGEKIVNS